MANDKPAQKWSPGAWTPKGCAVWNKLEGDAKADLEKWVTDEGQRETTYPTQLLPEHEAVLVGAPW